MRSRLGMVFFPPAALAMILLGGASALGQTAPSRGSAGLTTAQPVVVGYGLADPMLVDPVALNYLYATGAPMTRGQVGLSAASSIQRMTGIGSGRISGVRGGEVQPEERRSATHTRNSNVPGGQASRFFNRVGSSVATSVPASASAGNSQRYYGRQSHYFPQPAR